MPSSTFYEDCRITTGSTTAAGTDAVTSAVIDSAGYDSVVFIVGIGTAHANNNITIQCGTDATCSDAADLAGCKVISTANTVLMCEVKNPPDRYLQCVVTRGSSTTVNFIMAIQYQSHVKPAAAPATGTIRELHVNPIEGTA